MTDTLERELTAEEVDWIRRPLEEDEKEAYREYNESAGRRRVGGRWLPWGSLNIYRAINDYQALRERYPRVIDQDVENFRRATGRLPLPLDLRRAIEEDERDAFRAWNTLTDRSYNSVTLPWLGINVDRVMDDPAYMSRSFGEDAVWGDFEAFRRATGRDGFVKKAEPEPWAPPEDDSGPISVDDPRVRHIWVQAADVSRHENFCGSYDTIAREVGVPTRDVLRRTGELVPEMVIKYRPTIEFKVPNPERNGFRTLAKDLTGANFREKLTELLATRSDEELKSIFGDVNDYTELD